jgi:hypothetical protein
LQHCVISGNRGPVGRFGLPGTSGAGGRGRRHDVPTKMRKYRLRSMRGPIPGFRRARKPRPGCPRLPAARSASPMLELPSLAVQLVEWRGRRRKTELRLGSTPGLNGTVVNSARVRSVFLNVRCAWGSAARRRVIVSKLSGSRPVTASTSPVGALNAKRSGIELVYVVPEHDEQNGSLPSVRAAW